MIPATTQWKCAAMKYVSGMKRSTGVLAMKIPESPPIVKVDKNEIAWIIGVVKRIEPPHSVPSQLNDLIADGTAMTIVVSMNDVPSAGLMPLTNMWWPYTIHERNAIEIIE